MGCKGAGRVRKCSNLADYPEEDCLVKRLKGKKDGTNCLKGWPEF